MPKIVLTNVKDHLDTKNQKKKDSTKHHLNVVENPVQKNTPRVKESEFNIHFKLKKQQKASYTNSEQMLHAEKTLNFKREPELTSETDDNEV